MANHKLIIPFILQHEGGLSRAKTDTASKNPSPYTYKGYSDWHTNKGITWSTFKGLATKIGYAVNECNWFNMPSVIWDAIFKRGFWDALSLDKVNSQSIANIAADFAWGAGPHISATRLQSAVNNVSNAKLKIDGEIGPVSISAINQANTVALFKEFTRLKDNYYDTRPNSAANQKGWNLRHSKLVELSIKYLPAAGAGLIGTGLLFF